MFLRKGLFEMIYLLLLGIYWIAYDSCFENWSSFVLPRNVIYTFYRSFLNKARILFYQVPMRACSLAINNCGTFQFHWNVMQVYLLGGSWWLKL